MLSRLLLPISPIAIQNNRRIFLNNYKNLQIYCTSFYSTSKSISQSPQFQISQTVFDGNIPLDKVQISYTNASGPGGQHVNKAKTKVEVRFHVQSATWIPEPLKNFILQKEGYRITKDGYFMIQSDKTRQQLLNQADCFERIRRMIRERLIELMKPEPPTETVEHHKQCKLRENEKRLQMKRTLSMTKAYRQKPSMFDL